MDTLIRAFGIQKEKEFKRAMNRCIQGHTRKWVHRKPQCIALFLNIRQDSSYKDILNKIVKEHSIQNVASFEIEMAKVIQTYCTLDYFSKEPFYKPKQTFRSFVRFAENEIRKTRKLLK